MRTFDNAADFLKHYLATAGQHIEVTLPDAYYREIHGQATEHNVEMALPASGEARSPEEVDAHFRPLLDSLQVALEAVVDDLTRARLSRDLAFGTVAESTVNALCVRSRDAKYAICFHAGLFEFLSKISKYQIALAGLGSISFCTRKPAAAVTRDDLVDFCQTLIDNYRNTGEPRGPGVTLEPRMDTLLYRSALLKSIELFILAHEIAHFLNGDLERHYVAVNAAPDHSTLNRAASAGHQMEFRADTVGYVLAFLAFQRSDEAGLLHRLSGGTQNAHHYFLGMVALFFELLNAISPGASRSHPDPPARVANIGESLYGLADPELVQRALYDPDAADDLLTPRGAAWSLPFVRVD